MIGNVAAAIDLVQRDAACGQHFVGGKNVRSLGVPPQREHGRVLKQQKHVAHAALLAQRDKFFLHAQGLGIVHAPEIDVLNHPLI